MEGGSDIDLLSLEKEDEEEEEEEEEEEGDKKEGEDSHAKSNGRTLFASPELPMYVRWCLLNRQAPLLCQRPD